MLSDVIFQELQTSDIPLLVEYERKNSLIPWSERLFSSSFQTQLHRCFGLYDHHQCVAYLVVKIVAREAEILLVGVAPEHQGKGLGRLLLSTWLEQLHYLVDHIFLEVRESNQRAIHLYESIGFNNVGLRENYYPGLPEQGIFPEHAIVMAMPVGNPFE